MNVWFYIIYIINLILLNLIFLNSKIISNKIGLYKKKEDKTPLVGGLGIFVFLLIYFFSLSFKYDDYINIVNLNILLLIFHIFLIGFLDDLFELSYQYRLFFIFFILLIFIYFNKSYLVSYLYFETFNKTFLVGFLSIFLTPFFILLLINSLNMADGVNGNSTLITLTYLMLMYEKNLNINILILGLILPLIFFLVYNFKNKTYLGDSGIYLLSILISLYVIYKYNFTTTSFSCEKIFLIFMIPGLDMFRLFILRILNNKNPFKGDKNHFHHLLLRKFKLKTSLILYMSLIIWPNLLIKFLDVEPFILIIVNSLMFFSIIFYLKNWKNL